MYQRIQNEILKEQVSLKIHPFRLVTIVQWWQQSSVSVFWLLALAVSGNFPGSLWLLWLFRLFSCHTHTSQEIVLYQVQRNYVVTDVSLKSFKKLAEPENGWAYWEIRCATQYKECYQSQYSSLSSSPPLSQYHNPGKIYHGNTMETSSQYQHQYTSPTPLSTIFTVDSCSIL